MDVNNLSGSAHRLHNVVYARFEAVANAEKITRVELGHLSRELLIYVTDTQDIDIVNRLINVLTPVNRRVAILYFTHFLPWDKETEKDGETFVRFGKKHKGDKQIARKMSAIAEWLKDEANNIWSWSDENVEIKAKDFKATVTKAIKKAIEGDEKSATPPLDPMELMAAIFDGGVTIDMMLAAVIDREEKNKAALALVETPVVTETAAAA
jgi:hypothetical protein